MTAEPVRAVPTIAGRYLVVGAVAVVLGALHLRHRPASLCVVRSLTGVPCPFCGGTTAAVDVGHGDLRAALAASPLAVAMLSLGPLLTVLQRPAWWQVRRTRVIILLTVLAVSEAWQLHRFGIISF